MRFIILSFLPARTCLCGAGKRHGDGRHRIAHVVNPPPFVRNQHHQQTKESWYAALPVATAFPRHTWGFTITLHHCRPSFFSVLPAPFFGRIPYAACPHSATLVSVQTGKRRGQYRGCTEAFMNKTSGFHSRTPIPGKNMRSWTRTHACGGNRTRMAKTLQTESSDR